MDIRFGMVFLVLASLSSTDAARYQRRLNRESGRTVRQYLAPPSPDAGYATYGPPANLAPYRPGNVLTTEAPGYFSRLASWLNPFGGSPTPPPFADLPFHPYGQPPETPQGQPPAFPQPPPAGPQGYLPPGGKGKLCSSCDKVPWVPLRVVEGYVKDPHTSSSVNENTEVQPGFTEYNASPSQEVRTPDFNYNHSPITTHQQLPLYPPLGNPPPGPIPYPHLYPGPVPPLFKSKPFRPDDETHQPTQSVLPTLLEYTGGPITTISDSQVVSLDDGYVDILPSNGEEISLVSDEPILYVTRDPSPVYGSPDSDVQQSELVQEQHSQSASLSGHNTDGKNVEIVSSNTAEYSQTIEHPVQYEQSPIIDVESKSQGQAGEYAIGMNPPPNGPAESYGPPSGQTSTEINSPKDITSGEVLKSSYGVPLVGDPSKGSPVSQTYGNPGVNGLPIVNGTVGTTVYELYPPLNENLTKSLNNGTFKDEVNDPSQRPAGSSVDAEQLNKELLSHHNFNGSGTIQSQDQHGSQINQELVDSYQHYIEHRENLNNQQTLKQSSTEIPEPLVPYRPSPLYVPYPPYPSRTLSNDGQNFVQTSSSTASGPTTIAGPTTEEPFLEALMKSYNNFKQEMAIKDQMFREHQDRMRAEHQGDTSSGGTILWSTGPRIRASSPDQVNSGLYTSSKMMPPLPEQPPASKRNKQVQIIIPYTSRYTPSPFQPSDDDWSGRGPLQQTQARKVPVVNANNDNSIVTQESVIVEVTQPPKSLANLLMREISRAPVGKANNSIDVLRLQKNIDNWTIQEYSRGMTSSTALPSSSHPYLLPSKKIPDDYLTTTQPSAPEERRDVDTAHLSGFNYNDLEREGSASSRIEVPHVQILRIEATTRSHSDKTVPTVSIDTGLTTRTTTTASTPTTEASWGNVDVSISPHNNERVYVVTPLPASRSPKIIATPDDKEPGSEKANEELKMERSKKFYPVERAYQVLPQAVNNLAVASTGPENTPLWGIMEHEEYAKSNGSTSRVSISYSGHSKVSSA